VKLGIEVLAAAPKAAQAWGRCALLCNQASVTQNFKSSWDLLRDLLGSRLVAFFGPQHGFHATVQDNMIETGHHNAGPFGLPVYSLYSETREPRPEMLDGVDTIIIDLQIVGCRVYTFKYTIAGCLRIAKKLGKRVVVLDRPNPLAGEAMEGRVLDLKAKSFVGEYAIPLRHGLSVAESARCFNAEIGAELEIIPMDAWNPKAYWGEYYKHWILTSPNLPTVDPVYVYPATVMLEGTNLSEGRGTGLPFQFVGAPYIKDGAQYAARVNDYYRSVGVYLRPAEFQPTSQKWAGDVCRGFQIHVVDPHQIHTFPLGLAIMKAAMDLAPQGFAWKGPGYEYDFTNLPINLILGHLKAHEHIEKNFSVKDPFWSEGLTECQKKAEGFLLYPRSLKPMLVD
jgi:uncharacterized protein YbbC (DUF1343 family)